MQTTFHRTCPRPRLVVIIPGNEKTRVSVATRISHIHAGPRIEGRRLPFSTTGKTLEAAVIPIPAMVLIFLAGVLGTAQAADNPAIEAMRDYMEFATYSDGAISPEQIAGEDLSQFHIVDTRNAGQYDAGHIPGAVNIEWRQILARRDELPTEKTILLYCETGLLSSKAHFALRVAGYDNVKVLWGGYVMWSARQDFDKAQAQTGSPARGQ